MNIVIFPANRGRPRSFRLTSLLAVVIGALIVAGIVGNLFWLKYSAAGLDVFATESNAQTLELRAEIAEQKSVLNALRDQAASDSLAVGRRLASMQARFMRLEAVGERLTEVAGLVDGEFSFGQPAAVGGPEERAFTSTSDLNSDFATQLNQLSEELNSREVELNVLDGLLANRKLADERSPRPRPITWGWLSSPYGNRVDPITGRPGWHRGVDFAGEEGSSVVAVAGGVVTYAGTRSGYGELVEINHGDGYVTRYGHHKKVLVKVGDVVKKGEQIGQMGSTGRSTGPHVHFEVLKDGRNENPVAFLGQRS